MEQEAGQNVTLVPEESQIPIDDKSHKKLNIKLIIGVVCVIVGLIIVALAYFFRFLAPFPRAGADVIIITETPHNSNGVTIAQRPAIQTESYDYSNWKLFEDQQYGFTFKYPPGWDVESAKQGDTHPDLIYISSTDFKEEGLNHSGTRIYLAQEPINGQPHYEDLIVESSALQWQNINATFYISNTHEGYVAVISTTENKPVREIYTVFSNLDEFNSFREVFMGIATSISDK